MQTQKEFKHFVITRMNVDWQISRPRSDRNDPEFLSRRFALFEQICLPSVKAQTNKNFLWLMLLDAALPAQFKEKVEKYRSIVGLIPVYVESRETLLDSVRRVVREHTDAECKYLITTSLDSDDAISKDFLQLVQAQFRQQEFEFVNFLFGYLYRTSEQKLYLREWLTSPFYSLIESYNDDFKTVLEYGHTQVNEFNNCQIVAEPLWLMVAHGNNVRTNFDVSAAWQPVNRLGSNFAVDLDFPESSKLKVFKEMVTEIYSVLKSKKEWDTTKVKVRKISNIISPSTVRILRKIKFNSSSQAYR
jgi:hypothetical protein